MEISTRYFEVVKNIAPPRIRDLIDRLARLSAAEDWNDALNPAQRSALTYLAQANRFSRAPSHVAGFLCTTRGTASQTLKSLERKGLIASIPSAADRRSLSYELTAEGTATLSTARGLDAAVATLERNEAKTLEEGLESLLEALLAQRGYRSFGICKTCRHHEKTMLGPRCALLGVALRKDDIDALCHEHSSGA